MQYIHWNKRPYIHDGAVKRQDIFIWFITLFHLIHEQLASGDRRERGRLVLSSLTLHSVALARRGKRTREREREEGERDRRRVSMLSLWEPLIPKSIWTQQRHTLVVAHIDHSRHARCRKKDEAFNSNEVEMGCCLEMYCMINYT